MKVRKLEAMSDSHNETTTTAHGQEASHETGGKSSPKRLLLITAIMLGFAALSWGISLFSKGPTGISNTAGNFSFVFIPAWLTLTIGTVVISVWFTKRLLTAEKYRDSEAVPQGAASHSH